MAIRGRVPTSRWLHPVLLVVLGFLLAGLVGLLLLAPVALTHRDAGNLERAYGNAVIGLVTRVQGAGLGPNPVGSDDRTLEAGRNQFTGSCSQCHGAQGDGRGAFGATTFPPATDLTSADVRNLRDGQLFYIIKNGLGFTPMPGYASQYSDQQIWELVSFIRSLQAGSAPALAVPTPTGEQLSVANLPPGGDATRGAALFAAKGCSACHGPTGPLSINPANDAVARTVREGKPQGMPCFTPAALPDDQLRDIQAYIATFPPSGFLGGPEDVPPPGAGNARPPGATPAPRGVVGSPCATPTPGPTASGATRTDP